jgi:hypothetical protein
MSLQLGYTNSMPLELDVDFYDDDDPGPQCDMCGGSGRISFPSGDQWFDVECSCQQSKVKRELRSIDADWAGC